MTVLHSRNADAADPADVAAADAAADVKDPQDAAAEPDLREDLGRYAELGAFTLSADTHAWYAAVDTVATPEDARAASTVLAELRGRDLQQLWETVTALVTEVRVDEPATVTQTAALVETLQRVRTTSATLIPAAYDTDLGPLVAATADSAWRKERDVKVSWLRGRSLRKQAAALAHDRRIRREDLHEALSSALVERRAWALLAPAGTLPKVPSDGKLVETTAQAFEALGAGLTELARLLPGRDLDGIAFADLVELVERLAADEGTLYRLPTIRGLRATLEEAGLGELLAELAAARADRRAAEAAYAARQALAGGQRDGLAGAGTEAPETEAETEVEAEADVEVEVEAEVEADANAEAAALQALASGQRDGLAEDAPAETETVEVEAAEVEVEVAPVEVEATEVEAAEAEVETADAEEPEAAVTEETDVVVADDEPLAEVATENETEEAPAAAVSLPAPSPAADDLVDVVDAVTVVAETAEAEQAEVEQAEVETEPEAVEAVAEEPEAVEEPTAVAETAVEAEPEVTVEAEAPTAAPETVVEAETETETETEPVVEAEAVEVEPEAVTAAPETVVEAEPVAEAEAPTVEPEPVVEAEPEPVVEAEAADEAAPAKPDFTPGRPVTAYSADELLAIVRWIDADGTDRSDEELLRAAMKELGFARLGPRIKEALGAAVTAARG
ncbi:hypothetical protein [Kitasatospora sp. NPDC101183]|uniref:hypothetical protein n=1 Tax=Kitasatospora sp. NPDC101183 TaxID=3364100 RepID=UPI003825FB72